MSPSLAQITKQLLASFNRYPRKRLGQHFLIDPLVVERILRAAELTRDDLVIEIGSGLGVVTAEIAKQANHLIAIEIDKELVSISKSILGAFNNITFIEKDILKVELPELVHGRKYKVIGNLPYYITAPIVEKIIQAEVQPEVAVVMVQKEVAERMVAKPGSKKFGSFSIFVQFYVEVEINSFVSKSSFLPWPEVGSAVVVLKPHKSPRYTVQNEKIFFDIVHAAFQQRRKTLKNSLAKFNLIECGINLGQRPEMLSLAEFAQLANSCYNPRHETKS